MERILVGMSGKSGAWEAWSRAISLAKRIDARVYALLVLCPFPSAGYGHQEKEASVVRQRLELLIELGKSEGVPIDYFISEGDYEEEVIRFVDQNRISLLVVECTDGENLQKCREDLPIRKILHRAKCRVELIGHRKIEQLKIGVDHGHGNSATFVSTDRRK